METVKRALIPLVLCVLSACNLPGKSTNSLRDFTIEQNTIGTYVFCTNADCPKATAKTIAQAIPYIPSVPAVNAAPQYKYKVYFALGKAGLDRTATNHLNRWLPELKQANTIYLRGWADSVGGKNTTINRRLSKQRALNVQAWLKKRGVRAQVVLNSQPPCCNQQNTRIVAIEIKE